LELEATMLNKRGMGWDATYVERNWLEQVRRGSKAKPYRKGWRLLKGVRKSVSTKWEEWGL